MRDVLQVIAILVVCAPLVLLGAAFIGAFMTAILGILAILAVGAAVAMPISALMGKPAKGAVVKKDSASE